MRTTALQLLLLATLICGAGLVSAEEAATSAAQLDERTAKDALIRETRLAVAELEKKSGSQFTGLASFESNCLKPSTTIEQCEQRARNILKWADSALKRGPQ